VLAIHLIVLVDSAVIAVIKGRIQVKQILEYFIKSKSSEKCNSILQVYSVSLHSKCNLATIMKKSLVPYSTYTFFSTPKAKLIKYVTKLPFCNFKDRICCKKKSLMYDHNALCLINTMLSEERKKKIRLRMYVCIYIQYYVFIMVSIKTTHPLMTNTLLKVTSFSSFKKTKLRNGSLTAKHTSWSYLGSPSCKYW